MKSLISMLTVAALLSSGAAIAETAKVVTPTAKPAVATAPAKVKAPHVATARSEISKKCSADADVKNLHGKERKTFRHTCMKAA